VRLFRHDSIVSLFQTGVRPMYLSGSGRVVRFRYLYRVSTLSPVRLAMSVFVSHSLIAMHQFLVYFHLVSFPLSKLVTHQHSFHTKDMADYFQH